MDSRREFIKKATALAGGIGIANTLPASVQRALAIDPVAGSTFLDAEHIVILMQENRSFDHCYGTLQGVRGFNDPRAMIQPDGNKVWMQKNAAGETYLPFRLNIKETKSTWTGSLPHSRNSQVDARNNGRYDKWLIAKASGKKDYANAPLTLGFYNREDLPFYYALADAFTICDQNFCSSLTGTTPNRLHLWTGTVRSEKNVKVHANLTNADVDYGAEASWPTFPERLEDNGISWKIYQNEISMPTGLSSEEDAWLSNFGDNPIEWFTQYHPRFAKSYRDYMQKMVLVLPAEISALELKEKAGDATVEKDLLKKKELLAKAKKEIKIWTPENYEKLSARDKSLHERAFTTNSGDPFYRELETFKYMYGGTERSVQVPKGDVLYQFREDVKNGSLPAVSWLVAPENFSEHPDAPWYGAWYVSEAMDILTHNPEVWKKTIFILCYDENDGYFDHVPPFVPNDPNVPGTGRASEGLDTLLENVTEDNNTMSPRKDSRTGAIGLGFRVPLVIASPWSRGGAVCSEVFDHTSVIQLMEKIFSKKTGKKIQEENITSWRRAMCGDLSSVFRAFDGKKLPLQNFLEQHEVIESIHKVKFLKNPSGYKALTGEEIKQVNLDPMRTSFMPHQEKGIRPGCPIPYELYVDGEIRNNDFFEIQFKAGNEVFGANSAGSPFVLYSFGKPIIFGDNNPTYEPGKSWNYAVSAGDKLIDLFSLMMFEKRVYHFAVHGPNGFFREFKGDLNDPGLSVSLDYERSRHNRSKLTGNLSLRIFSTSIHDGHELLIKDNSYKNSDIKILIEASGSKVIILNTAKSFGWYDFTITSKGNSLFTKRYAGHVETGAISFTDPAMGGMIS